MTNTGLSAYLKLSVIIWVLFSLTVEASTPLSSDYIVYKGHIKYQAVSSNIPQDSLYHNFSADPAVDSHIDMRLSMQLQQPSWILNTDYQILARAGDHVLLTRATTGSLQQKLLPDDEARLMDLTQTITDSDKRISAHRLDRLNLYYAGQQSVVKIGRQTISWGNGLSYNPMDFFNPFDPAAFDHEYKPGDDMLYVQHLYDNGDDLQIVWVGRRDDEGNISHKVTSSALKYHSIKESVEFDILLASHFDSPMLGLGVVASSGGAIWRSDAVLTRVNNVNRLSAILNLSYSWQTWGRNISAGFEYYHNGFGISDGDYSQLSLDNNNELLDRISRGELYTPGRDYVSASATIEIQPLWLATPAMFININDRSFMLQLISQHDLAQNLQLTIAATAPAGRKGSEYGGIDSAVPDKHLGMGNSLSLHLGWFF